MSSLKLEVLPAFQGAIIKDLHIISTPLNYSQFDIQDAHKMMQYKYQWKTVPVAQENFTIKRTYTELT